MNEITVGNQSAFQYPEGFWPDSDSGLWALSGVAQQQSNWFQYPEGFWPDSDSRSLLPAWHGAVWFQYPKGFWPDSDYQANSDMLKALSR